MSATFSMRIHLRGLVLALTVFSAIAATANALYASYCVQRDQLIANTLESTASMPPSWPRARPTS